MAGEGLPLYLWTGLAEAGQSPWEVGQDRAMRDTGGFSYRNAVVREEDGRVVACLIGYPLEEAAPAVDHAQLPPMFVPLQQLEDMVPGTWYVNVLATYPEHRGKGYGRELLEIAEDLASSSGKRGMSIIVADSNAGARKLYEQQGYIERARRPMVKAGWQSPGSEWVLLVKPLLTGSCHCGAVTLELPAAPVKATECNCSLCRRLGALWAYYEFGTVRVSGHPEHTQAYIQGDRTLRTVRCATCGCATHWEPLNPEPGARHGVNLRNFDPRLLERVRIRRFDGADTWTFLD